MRSICALSVLCALTAAVASAQSGPVKVLIRSTTQPASAGPEVQAIARYFENRVAELLAEKYPCANVVTMADLATLLGHDRQRQLLGGKDEGVLGAVAGALGANYMVALTVTPFGSGQVSLTGSVMNAATAQAVARETSTSAGGSKAVEGVDAVAQRLVQSLSGVSRFSKETCEPTNPWTGTVTYRVVKTRRSTETSDDKTTTTTLARNFVYEATIRIGWTGPPKVQATARETTHTEEVNTSMRDCGGRVGLSEHVVKNMKSAGYRNVDDIESSAASDGGTIASVSASVAAGKIKLQLSVSAIDGTTRGKSQKHFDGGCGDPTTSTVVVEPQQWVTNELQGWAEIEAPAATVRPGEQAGSMPTDGGEGTVTWKLTRTPLRK